MRADSGLSTAAEPRKKTSEERAIQRRCNVSNLAILARQAITQEHPTMSVDPRIVADFCSEYEAMARRVEGEDSAEREAESSGAEAESPSGGFKGPGQQ